MDFNIEIFNIPSPFSDCVGKTVRPTKHNESVVIVTFHWSLWSG